MQTQITQEKLNEIVEKINNKSRKYLGYYTPKEIFLKKLRNGVTLPP